MLFSSIILSCFVLKKQSINRKLINDFEGQFFIQFVYKTKNPKHFLFPAT